MTIHYARLTYLSPQDAISEVIRYCRIVKRDESSLEIGNPGILSGDNYSYKDSQIQAVYPEIVQEKPWYFSRHVLGSWVQITKPSILRGEDWIDNYAFDMFTIRDIAERHDERVSYGYRTLFCTRNYYLDNLRDKIFDVIRRADGSRY